jgi:hypothetical protein
VKLFPFAVILSVPFFAACSGSNSSLPQSVLQTTPLDLRTQTQTMSEAQADVLRQPQSSSSSADLLYIGNRGNNSITVYRHDASGNAAPKRVIAGARTGLSNPGQLAEDAAGNLYVANGAGGTSAVLVFARGANGNVAPTRVLGGPATGIHTIGAMTVDAATGKLFLEDIQYQTAGFLVNVSLLRFGPGANGNTAPFARSQPGLFPSNQLTSDSTGHNLIDAHATNEPSNFGVGVDTLGKQFANNLPPTPSGGSSINSFFAGGIADDPTTKTYWVSSFDYPANVFKIYRLAENTVGNGTYEGNPENLSPKPAAIVTNAACSGQLGLGYLRNLYLACSDAVYIYAPNSTGSAAPLRTLKGSATMLNGAYGIFEGQ